MRQAWPTDQYTKAWFSGTVISHSKVQTCMKIGREKYIYRLRIVFDGAAEATDGELVDFDDGVRLLKRKLKSK